MFVPASFSLVASTWQLASSRMKTSIWEFSVGLCVFLFASCTQATFRDDPTVLVTLLVRNKAHTLPYFLKLFEELDYPKSRLTLW